MTLTLSQMFFFFFSGPSEAGKFCIKMLLLWWGYISRTKMHRTETESGEQMIYCTNRDLRRVQGRRPGLQAGKQAGLSGVGVQRAAVKAKAGTHWKVVAKAKAHWKAAKAHRKAAKAHWKAAKAHRKAAKAHWKVAKVVAKTHWRSRWRPGASGGRRTMLRLGFVLERRASLKMNPRAAAQNSRTGSQISRSQDTAGNMVVSVSCTPAGFPRNEISGHWQALQLARSHVQVFL